MIERALIGILPLPALAAGAVLAGGWPAYLVAAIAVPVLLVTVIQPGWAHGPTLVAAALIVQVAVADERSWWRAVIAAVLLAAVLAAGEISQSGTGRADLMTALSVHGRAVATAAVSAAAVAGAAQLAARNAALAMLLIGFGAAAAVAVLTVVRPARSDV